MAIKEVLPDVRTLKALFPASTAIAFNDLLYKDPAVAGGVKKASQQADQLTAAANQRLFAANFLGVSADQRLAAESGAGDRVVVTDGIFDANCASTTWEFGDLVGPVEDAGG